VVKALPFGERLRPCRAEERSTFVVVAGLATSLLSGFPAAQQQVDDPDFKVTVANPAYSQNGARSTIWMRRPWQAAGPGLLVRPLDRARSLLAAGRRGSR
jgi:hypothetical protein